MVLLGKLSGKQDATSSQIRSDEEDQLQRFRRPAVSNEISPPTYADSQHPFAHLISSKTGMITLVECTSLLHPKARDGDYGGTPYGFYTSRDLKHELYTIYFISKFNEVDIERGDGKDFKANIHAHNHISKKVVYRFPSDWKVPKWSFNPESDSWTSAVGTLSGHKLLCRARTENLEGNAYWVRCVDLNGTATRDVFEYVLEHFTKTSGFIARPLPHAELRISPHAVRSQQQLDEIVTVAYGLAAQRQWRNYRKWINSQPSTDSSSNIVFCA